MKAQEIKDKYLKEGVEDICGVIAIGEGTWFHVHDDEEVPEGEDFTIAIHPRKLRETEKFPFEEATKSSPVEEVTKNSE